MAYIDTSSDKWNPGITGQLSGSDYRFQLDIYSRKLLFSLASRLKGNEAKFPEWQIPFDLLFNLLNLNKTNNRRYDILRSTISRIKKSTLEYRQDEKHWGKLSLFAVAKIKEDNPYSAIFRFNNDVKRYLFNLTRYCTLYPHYYRELSNNYSLWLYPILKNASSQFISKYVLSLEEIKELTFNETTTSYNPQKNKDANRNILKNILGLEKKRGGIHYLPTVRLNKQGKAKGVGTIAEINEKTDLYISCKIIKKGKKIQAVLFKIYTNTSSPRKLVQKGERALRAELKKTRREDHSLKINQSQVLKPEVSIPMQTVEEIAAHQSVPIEKLLRELGYKRVGDRAVKL